MMTGFFAIPGSLRESDCTKVHLVSEKKPVCGSHLRIGMEFQWCAEGMHWGYLECERCKKIYAAQMKKENPHT